MSEAIEALRKKLIKKAKFDVSEKYSEKDSSIIRAVNVLNDLDSIFNLLAEHAIEWHGMNFPELNFSVKDNEKYLLLIKELGGRENFSWENVSKILQNDEIAKIVSEKAVSSMGAKLDLNSMKEIQSLCAKALDLKTQRNDLANFLEKEMAIASPNFTKLAGALLGAKLLNEAGSFRRLAELPSSTIQVLGAEKALFMHLKSGTSPPKHGLIFQHPLVKRVKPWQKGNISRTLAGKLSIAIKTDFYGNKENIADELLQKLEKRVLEIEKQKPVPKKKQFSHQNQFSQQNRFSQNKPFRKNFERKNFSPRKSFGENRSFGETKSFDRNPFVQNKSFGENKRFGKKTFGEKKEFGKKPFEKKPFKKFGQKKPAKMKGWKI